jgi:16S rRNA (cytidine1402-2'-O)-methyltransferase
MLNLISTPIGNLNDISLRAIEALKSADYIFAEDTRNAKKLLNFIDCRSKCFSFHEHNEKKITNLIVKKLIEDQKLEIAIISDAGTPAISDPGYHLIQECINHNINFSHIPGPSSIINAVVLSGLPTSSFTFLGFVPKKKNQKIEFMRSLKKYSETIILFESGKRLPETIQYLFEEHSKHNKISLCREMTKIHETIERGTIALIKEKINSNELVLKGEFVIVIEGSSTEFKNTKLDKKIQKAFLENMPPKDAAKLISMITNENKRDVYKELLELD